MNDELDTKRKQTNTKTKTKKTCILKIIKFCCKLGPN